MSLEDIKSKVKIAQEAVKDVDAELRKGAFEIILNKLLEGSIGKGQARSRIDASEKKQVKVKGTAPVSMAPIPLNLKGGNGTPSLRDFFSQKSPSSGQEKVTVFVYYINKYLGINDVLPGHIISCYNEVNEKKPLDIIQLFRDTKRHKGWLALGEATSSVKISIAGENLVEHDLPKAKK